MTSHDIMHDERTQLTSKNKFELLLFRLGQARPGVEPALYGINVFKVREIITNREITPIAGAPDVVSGAIDIRGQIIPVIELCKLTRNTPTREPNILLITEFARTTQAFAVERRYEVAEASTFATPVLLGSNILVRDATGLILLTGK